MNEGSGDIDNGRKAAHPAPSASRPSAPAVELCGATEGFEAARESKVVGVGQPSKQGLRVVGVGASAGGLESLEQLFAELPPDPGMAFVVVQHLSPDFRSMMDELLARRSSIPVSVAENGQRVQANHIYLLPPRKEMIIRDGCLVLTDKEPTHGLALPIDKFLRSLALDVGRNASAIILSGSGSDGSRGVREVKLAGGVVMVESPDSAKFNGMPLSAQATGMADYVGAPAEIARQLIGRRQHVEEVVEVGPMEAILRLLRNHFGIDFSFYKKGTVTRRIQRRIELKDSPDLGKYAERLANDVKELSSLYHDLLIGVTQFFRDREAFQYLERHAIPELIARVPDGEELRVWVAGCATGEEAYSIAMLLYEQLEARGRQVRVKILATDVHRDALETASTGLYDAEHLAHVTEARHRRFFTKTASGYQVSPELRQLIVFAPHNVTRDAPFTRMHLISCRNMLIYLEPPAQKTVLSLFHFGLASKGILFLGASESTGGLSTEFDVLDERAKIYRKRRDVRLAEPLAIALNPGEPAKRPPQGGLFRGSAAPENQLAATYDQLLDRYMPPSFIVDENRNLLDSFGGAERLFRLGRRRPSTNILDLLEGDLRIIVSGAIQRALRQSVAVRYTGVRIGDGNDEPRHTLTAEPIVHRRTGVVHVLISLDDEGMGGAAEEGDGGSRISGLAISAESQDRLQALEGELSYTKETLQATVEELQTSNEELQAANEELVASNEELQSTNEELHSVNEELYTVNAEYQKKILELKELNGDMQHLLEGTDVGTLFIDRELRIRKYTPRIAGAFRIQPQDIGRGIEDFSHNIQRPSLMDDLRRALTHGEVIEEETRDTEGTSFFLRILPYRVAGTKDAETGKPSAPVIEGVVLTLTDISALERARSKLLQLSAIVESSEDAIIGQDLEGTITSWNRGAERLYGYVAEEAVGRNIRFLLPPGLSDQVGGFLAAIRAGERLEQIETIRMRKDGQSVDVSVTISPIRDEQRRVVGASAIARDITQLKRAQRDLEEREERIRMLLNSTAEAIVGLDREGICTFCNPACVRMLGYASSEDLVGRAIYPLIHCSPQHAPADVDEGRRLYEEVLRTGKGRHSDTELLWRADGTCFDAEYWSYPLKRDGAVEGAVVTFLDITDRKRAEEEIREASARREQFLAMLSHELRNPLAAVLNATKLMQTADVGSEPMRRARDVVARQSAHMARLLDDLLDVSRITRGAFELRKEDVDLHECIRAAAEATDPIFNDRKIKLELRLCEGVLPTRGDAVRLQQVIANLLSNAARYSDPDNEVQLTTGRSADVLEVRVRDQGRGIPPHLLCKVFELFVQADQDLARADGGMGVGLTLVKRIVELHGGTVTCRSDGPGAGSEFIVRLPLQKHAILKTEGGVATRFVARRLVLVEDQDDAREMMRLLLESKGHIVLEAQDGPSAIALVEREHPDVALIDIGLPGMSGYEVARQIRARPVLQDVMLVALTGYGMNSDVETAKSAGFHRHLTKPADPNAIDQVLAERLA